MFAFFCAFLESSIFLRIRSDFGVTSSSSSVSMKSSACSRLRDTRRCEPERLVGTGGTGVGQMFCLADVEFNILGFAVLSDDHAGIYSFSGTDKQCAAFLSAVQAVSDGFACLKCDQ